MKVQICTGSKCTFYGANNIIERLSELSENLHLYPGLPEDAVLELEVIPCDESCKKGNSKVAPIVFVDGEKIERAKSSQIMEMVLNTLQEDVDEE